MTKDEFWQIVEECKASADVGDCEEQVRLIEEKLARLEPNEIEDFDRIYNDLRLQSYDNRLWAAAYIINGGCSDDGFEYFRGWLISRGREVFENALADPESLIAPISKEEGDLECESMLYAALQAYEKKTGNEMPKRPALNWVLKGDDWEEDTVDDLYPKLAECAEKRWE